MFDCDDSARSIGLIVTETLTVSLPRTTTEPLQHHESCMTASDRNKVLRERFPVPGCYKGFKFNRM
jgi:hypothetical protein